MNFIVNFIMNSVQFFSLMTFFTSGISLMGATMFFAKLSFLASESAIEQIQWLMVQCGLYQFSQELCSLQQIIVFKRYDIFCIGLDTKTV